MSQSVRYGQSRQRGEKEEMEEWPVCTDEEWRSEERASAADKMRMRRDESRRGTEERGEQQKRKQKRDN